MKTGKYEEGTPPSTGGAGYPDNFWSALSATYFFLVSGDNMYCLKLNENEGREMVLG